MNKWLWWTLTTLALAVAGAWWGCTPKTTQQTTETPVAQDTTQTAQPQPPQEKLSPCPTFDDAPNPDRAIEYYVLYHDFMKTQEYDQAFDYWRKVYEVAPAADGRRNSVFADGIWFYEYFLSKETDSLKREALIDTIFMLYDQVDKCYPEGGYIVGRKAFDLYYKYPWRAGREAIFQMFRQSIDMDSIKAQYFVLNPFTALLVEMHKAGKISDEEARRYVTLLEQILEYGPAHCEGEVCKAWEVVREYVPARLEYFETIKGFYDCAHYKKKYLSLYLENPDDCDVLRNVYSYLKWGGCSEDDPDFQQLIQVGNEKCREAGLAEVAFECLKNADYECAIEGFEKAAEEETDVDKKARYYLLIAKVYYAHLKNFPKARQYARKAASVKPDWGEPYLLIGRLYASSGPLCGPGRGWDSQVVTWVAIDEWQKAKRIDPGVADEANKLIARYSQYMPSREDIHQRLLHEGDTYFVGCWIQQRTTVRAAPK